MVVRSADEDCAQRRHASGSWAAACQVLSALTQQQLGLTRLSYEGALRACCSAGQWRQAIHLIGEMRVDGFTVPSQLHAAALCARASRAASYAEAKGVIVDAAAVPFHSTRVWNTLTEVALRTEAYGAAYSLRGRMARYEVPADNRTYELRVLLAWKQGKWGDCLRDFLGFKNHVARDFAIQSTAAQSEKSSPELVKLAAVSEDPELQRRLNDALREALGPVLHMVLSAVEARRDDPVARAVGEFVKELRCVEEGVAAATDEETRPRLAGRP
jgi:pentatricopeptide repeat protein